MSDFIFKDFRQPWETGAHWELKKQFIQKYRNDFSEDRLLCLAQAYSNIKLLNCSYPDIFMHQIHELSKSLNGQGKVSVNYKQSPSEQSSLKRSFQSEKRELLENCVPLGSSEKRIKYNSDGSREVQNIPNHPYHADSLHYSFHGSTNEKANKASIEVEVASSSEPAVKSLCEPSNRKGDSDATHKADLSDIQNFKIQIEHQLNLGRKVKGLYAAVINASNAVKMPLEFSIKDSPGFNRNTMYDCDFRFKNILLSSASGQSKKKARFRAVKSAVDMLLSASDFKIKECKITGTKHLESDNTLNTSNSSLANSCQSSTFISDSVSSKPFSLNENMLKASLQRQYVLYDNRENKAQSQRSPGALLTDSSAFSGTPLEYKIENDPPNSARVDILLKNEVISSVSGNRLKDVRKVASLQAMQNLQKLVYTIKEKKDDVDGLLIERQHLSDCELISELLAANNIKSIKIDMLKTKLLKATEPQEKHSQAWVIGALFEDFCKSNSCDDLIFSPELDKSEREKVKSIGSKFDIQIMTRIFNQKNYMRVRRKFKMPELLHHLVESGGSTKKYILLDASNES